MSATHERRNSNNYGNDEVSTGCANYRHSSSGFAHWLEVAPPTCSFEDVVAAYKQYGSPHDVFMWWVAKAPTEASYRQIAAVYENEEIDRLEDLPADVRKWPLGRTLFEFAGGEH